MTTPLATRFNDRKFMFKFSLCKTMQATSILMEAERRTSMNYMRLLKLLYIADRESLRLFGRPMTGARMVAMERGPVLSEVLDLVKGEHYASEQWSRYFAKDHYNLEMTASPGRGELSKAEIDILHGISESHRDHDEWEMVALTHEFPEWRKNDPGHRSKEIPLEDVLEAIGRVGDLDAIAKRAQDEATFDMVFGMQCP